MHKYQAKMTLVAVLIRIQRGHNVSHAMLHGLVHDSIIDDKGGLKKYAEKLAEREFVKFHLHADAAEGFIQQYAIVEYGIVQPDEVLLPFAECDVAAATLHSMEMVVATSHVGPEVDIDLHPDIKEVK